MKYRDDIIRIYTRGFYREIKYGDLYDCGAGWRAVLDIKKGDKCLVNEDLGYECIDALTQYLCDLNFFKKWLDEKENK